MREMHLFAGAGGGILGGMLLGHVPVCAVEIDKYCRRVLQARQDDGSLPPFPIYEDVKTFDGQPWRGLVDVVAGGFPCQPFSVAGKQLGTADPRHLWPQMARIIEEVRPRYVFAENVSLAAFAEPWRDLRRLGYRVPPAICVSASDVGAPHLRKRWWLLATDDRPDGPWIKCLCGDYWCRLHKMHAHDCDCPPVDEWASDPYATDTKHAGQAPRQDVESNTSKRAQSRLDGETGQVADAESQPKRPRLREGQQAGIGRRRSSNSSGEAPIVADATGAQNHEKRGDCQCRRDAVGRSKQASQRKDGATDHDCTGRRSSSSHPDADSKRLKEFGKRHSQPETGQQAPCRHDADGLRAPADTDGTRLEEREGISSNTREKLAATIGENWWAVEPDVGRVAHGVASRVDRLKALGNGQVPLTAATAWQMLMEADA